MRTTIKFILNKLCQLIALPFAITCWLESAFFKNSETVFNIWSHLFAILPGLPGMFLRRSYYCLTLQKCSEHCNIGFGTIFTHRNVIIEDNVYIGIYSIIGASHIGARSLIGSRVSIVSGKALHERDENGQWTPFDPSKLNQVKLGSDVWVGEGGLIMASVGKGCMVGAGAVVTTNVRDNVIVAGNPARFIRKLDNDSK